jgi:hypothetical protein
MKSWGNQILCIQSSLFRLSYISRCLSLWHISHVAACNPVLSIKHSLDELLESTVNRRPERLDVLVEVNG